LCAALEAHYAGDNDEAADVAINTLWDAVGNYARAVEACRLIPDRKRLTRYLDPVGIGGRVHKISGRTPPRPVEAPSPMTPEGEAK
jgi:hypothetical protein